MADNSAVRLNRTERILAFVLAAVAALSIIGILAVFIGRITGADLSSGVWPVIAVLPFIGLPIALVLAIVFIFVTGTRRRRLAAGDGRK